MPLAERQFDIPRQEFAAPSLRDLLACLYSSNADSGTSWTRPTSLPSGVGTAHVEKTKLRIGHQAEPKSDHNAGLWGMTDRPARATEQPYDPITSESWREAVESWPWEPEADGNWRKTGQCPRCGDIMSVRWEGAIALSPSIARRPVLAACNCRIEHAGHPAKPDRQWGCGARALIRPPE